MSMMVQSGRFAAAGGGGHRYWRVRITANNGEVNFASVGLLEMYSSTLTGAGRTDQCTGGTALANSDGFGGGDVRASAFDSRTDTQWAGNISGAYIGYDFGSGQTRIIDRISIRARAGGSANQAPMDFDIQYSDDGSSWTTSWSESGQTSWLVKVERLFTGPAYSAGSYTGSPHGAHRYWRILCLQSQAGSETYSAGEVEFRSTPSGSDQTGSGTPTAHSTFGGAPGSFDPAKAFDNNVSTLWSANGGSDYGWLEYDFGSTKQIAEVNWTARNDGVYTQSPRYISIQFSDDDSKWHTTWSADNGASGFSNGSNSSWTDPEYI